MININSIHRHLCQLMLMVLASEWHRFDNKLWIKFRSDLSQVTRGYICHVYVLHVLVCTRIIVCDVNRTSKKYATIKLSIASVTFVDARALKHSNLANVFCSFHKNKYALIYRQSSDSLTWNQRKWKENSFANVAAISTHRLLAFISFAIQYQLCAYEWDSRSVHPSTSFFSTLLTASPCAHYHYRVWMLAENMRLWMCFYISINSTRSIIFRLYRPMGIHTQWLVALNTYPGDKLIESISTNRK